MNILGLFSVFLCAILVCGQDAPATSLTESDSTMNSSADTPSTKVDSASTGAPADTTKMDPVPTTSSPSETTKVDPVTTASSPAETTKVDPVTTASSPADTTKVEPVTTSSVDPVTTGSTEPETTSTGGESTVPASTAAPTEAPTEAPSPDIKLYVNNTGTFCMVVNMEITLMIEYTNSTNNTVSNSYVLKNDEVVVDQEASTKCNASSDQSESLVATFDGKNDLVMQFNKTDSKVSVAMFRLSFNDIQNIFPDAMPVTNMILKSSGKLFETSDSKSYKCDAETKVDLVDDNGGKTNSYVTFKDVQVQAFRSSANTDFSAAEDCAQDDNVSDIVPIAVGCALAALVVIVLIAYLVGRRQKRQRGYESV